MAISTMYPAKNNSPKTILAAEISASDISITVQNANVLPEAPNLAVLGSGDNAEIISYSEIEGNVVKGLVRGLNGTVPSLWPSGTVVARNSTSYDHDIFIANIKDLDTRKANTADLGSLAALDAVSLTANVDGILPTANGGTGNANGEAQTAKKLSSARTIRTDLASTSTASFDGSANITPGVTGTLPIANGGTGGGNSGWLSLENSNVFTGTIHYRKIGIFVLVTAYSLELKSAISASSTYVDLGYLPDGFRPDSYEIWAGSGTLGRHGIINISLAGRLRFWKGQTEQWPTSNKIYFAQMFFANKL